MKAHSAYALKFTHILSVRGTSTKRANPKFCGHAGGGFSCDKQNFRLGFVVHFLWFVSFVQAKEMNAPGRERNRKNDGYNSDKVKSKLTPTTCM